MKGGWSCRAAPASEFVVDPERVVIEAGPERVLGQRRGAAGFGVSFFASLFVFGSEAQNGVTHLKKGNKLHEMY